MGNIEFTRKPKALLSCPNVINLHLYTLSIRPRILVDVSRIDMSTSILGYKLSAPIMVAPTAMHQLAHPEGEVATARGAAACNTIMVLSFNSTCTMEEVASSCDAVLFLQLYVFKRRDISALMVHRAEKNEIKSVIIQTMNHLLWRGAVHEASGLQDTGHILEFGKCIYNTTLNLSDLSTGVNRFVKF